jgi:DUF4097 and DUF4098 domain-containing protein YvlB
MKKQNRLATILGGILGALCAVLVLALQSSASESRAYTEEFHHTYPLTAGGRVDLENINGAVHISAWDRNEVKVDAIKYAGRKERLDQAKIEVSAGSDYVSIRTKYRDEGLTFNDHDWNNPAGVEYTVTVPRTARLDEIKLINGALDVQGVNGEVRASCVNGRLSARDLAGRAKLSTVNGRLEAQFEQLGGSPVWLSSVNGGVILTLPSDSKAELQASTASGGIENDFGLRVVNHRFVGHDLRGQLAGGGTHIELNNVNGRIEIRHANDNRALSPATDLNSDWHSGRNGDRDVDDDDEI